MPLTFPNGGDGAGQTTTYQYTYNGITQNWVWGRSIVVGGVPGPSAWIMTGFSLTAGEDGARGFQGFQGPTGTALAGFQGFQGFQGLRGLQGFQGLEGFQGRQGFQGNTGPTLPPVGNNLEIQYKDGSSLSANSRATIATNSNLVPSSGYSGNFLNYSESLTANNSTFSSGQSVTLNFNGYNIYRATNIALGENKSLTFSGFSSATTGQSMTLILGHTGASGSKIVIPGTENIFWPEGPLGNTEGGQTSTILPTTTKKHDILYFFSDGTNVYGNYSLDFRKS